MLALAVPGLVRMEFGGGRYGRRSSVIGCSGIVVLIAFSLSISYSRLLATAVDWPMDAPSIVSIDVQIRVQQLVAES